MTRVTVTVTVMVTATVLWMQFPASSLIAIVARGKG